MAKNNRKKYFDYLFDSKGHTIETMAEIVGIKRDSLYRKIIGVNGFSEKDIKSILKTLDMPFEKVFID